MKTSRASAVEPTSSPAGAVGAASRSLGRWHGRADRLRRPDLAAVRSLLDDLGEALDALNGAAGLEAGAARLVRNTALHASFPVLLLVREGWVEAAASQLVRSWQAALRGFGWTAPGVEALASEVAEPVPWPANASGGETEVLALFNLALFGRLTEAEGQERDRRTLARLMELLHLSFDQVGRMLGVSGETVRRWRQGSHRVPEERSAQIARADAALERLLEGFQPARLFQVVRRKADLFDGESALDWILRGRITEVADRYGLALTYQA